MNRIESGSSEMFQKLFADMPNGIAIYRSTDGESFFFEGMNSAGEKLSNVKYDEIAGLEIRKAFPGVVRMGLYSVLKRVWASGSPESLPVAFYSDQSLSRYYKNSVYKISESEIVAVYSDITAQREAEDGLLKSERRYRKLFESMREGFALYEQVLDDTGKPVDYRFLEVNPAFETLTGLKREVLIGRTVREMLPQIEDEWMEAFRWVSMTGQPSEVENFARDLGRYYRACIYSAEPDKLAVVFNDVTEQKKSLQELTRSEELMRMLFETSRAGILMVDPGGAIKIANRRMAEMLGYTLEELLQLPYPVIVHPDQRSTGDERMRKLIAGEIDHVATERHYIRKDGSDLWGFLSGLRHLDADGSFISLVGNITDITELKRAEEERLQLEQQLLHAQKLESLGVLAGGIAHDFNNILTSIIGNADLALMRINRESPAIENLHRIEQAASRAADLARQMLAYSGKGKFVVEQLDINRLLEEMLHMLEISISKKAVLRLNLHRPLPGVEGDATQLRQVIMNLVINASEAIGDESGAISVTTGCMDCDENYLKDVWLDENLGRGMYVYLEISDSGCGMDKETLSRIFDPFFTTKFTGRGLGMAAVLGIVRGHHGAIKIYSEPGKGSSFKILLPASGRPVEIFDGKKMIDDWRGSGTVLLVDDEETVRAIGSEMLKELGFEVLTANDGQQALEVYKTAKEVTFVILDLTMPRMDGEQCFRELRRINPDIRAIISSGFSEHEVTQKFAGKGLAGFIQKPYKFSELKEAVRAIPIIPA